ncbi:hypothetical protein HPB50_008587 [Hyalomma asiaticum]|uniref:Uncharacterized protein n=1 Tax=Hyalomma asiaticum TaxID=266040 RepID=A0ACB7SUC4_HYAAI|nr:hypothetical protein HPB50_008587 [Hyalomma asiaticum]
MTCRPRSPAFPRARPHGVHYAGHGDEPPERFAPLAVPSSTGGSLHRCAERTRAIASRAPFCLALAVRCRRGVRVCVCGAAAALGPLWETSNSRGGSSACFYFPRRPFVIILGDAETGWTLFRRVYFGAARSVLVRVSQAYLPFLTTPPILRLNLDPFPTLASPPPPLLLLLLPSASLKPESSCDLRDALLLIVRKSQARFT